VEKAHAIVMQDRRLTTRLLAERLGGGKEAARQILERDLQKSKICPRLGSHCETVSCFQIGACDPAPSHPNRQIWHRQTFLLFPKVKLALKGERFSDISDIQIGMTKHLKGISLHDFQRALEDLYKRSEHCVELGDDSSENL
jgi:hypothetical protein